MRLTLAEMAAASASASGSGSSIPLNATLHATRYLGAKAPDKRKVSNYFLFT